MRNIGNHGFQCPEFDDYAAVALYMQNLGTLIDAELHEQILALQSFQNRPTIIVTNALARVMASGAIAFNLYDTVLFNNSTFMSLRVDAVNSRTIIDIGSEIGAPTTIPYRRGSYSTGAIATQTAAAVTAFSERVLRIEVWDESLFGPSSVLGVGDVTFDTNTGGDESQNVKADFELSRTSGIEVRHSVSNTNAAGNVTITAGCLWWVTYNGPLEAIEVA